MSQCVYVFVCVRVCERMLAAIVCLGVCADRK